MKEHVQDYGVRKWAGDDLIELQAEPLSALQALVAPYAPCILTGCELETVPDGNGDGNPVYRLHAGYVALKGRKTVENGADAGTEGAENGAGGTEDSADAGVAATAENGDTAAAQDEEYVKIVRVTAQTVHQPTVFLALACTPLSRAYGNGENKAIAYDYTAEVCDVLSDVGDRPYLTLVADNSKNPRLPDTLGITQKLDRDGGEATDTVVTFSETFTETDSVPDRPELKSGSRLGLLMRQIRKWFDELKDLKALAFKEKVALTDLDADVKKELDGKVAQVNGMGLSEANFTTEEKLKLKDIKPNANNYSLPLASSTTRGGVKIGYTQSGRNYPVQLSDEKMYVNVPWTDTVYTHPTSAGNKHIPSGGSSGQYLKYYSSGTARWANPADDTATSSASGFMSAKDKEKLDSIDNGANYFTYTLPLAASGTRGGVQIGYTQSGRNYPVQLSDEKMYVNVPWTDTVYSHPTSAGNKHIPSGGSNGQYLKYYSSGTAQWVSPANNTATTSTSGFMSAADKKKLTDMGCTTGYFSGGTIYPGKVYLLSTNASVSVTKQTSFDSGSCVSYIAANDGSFRITSVNKGTGIGMIYMSQTAKSIITGTSSRVGIYKFIWSGGDVVYVDFICDQWYA